MAPNSEAAPNYDPRQRITDPLRLESTNVGTLSSATEEYSQFHRFGVAAERSWVFRRIICPS